MSVDIAAAKQDLIDSMKQAGITQIVVTYTGSGDSGGIEDITHEPEQTPLSDGLHEAACAFGDAVIDANHCGFENDTGGGGTITIDAEQGSAVLEAYDYVEETHEHGPVAV